MKLITGLAAAGLLMATPAAAQEDEPPGEAAMLALFQDAFAAASLTPSEQARLPEAGKVVALVVPEGFYGRMMSSMLDRMLGPIFGQVAVMSTADLAKRLGQEGDPLPSLDEDTRKRLTAIIDPAAEQRAAAVSEVLTGSMTQLYTQLEGPMRDGLARAYAVRFDERQLADISAFFATPTGAVYASESIAAFTDPQMIGALMQSMPLLMQQFPQMMGGFEAATAGLPSPRSYADLSADDRRQLAAAFGLSDAALREGMTRAEEEAASQSEAGFDLDTVVEDPSEPEDDPELRKQAALAEKLQAI